MKKGLKKVVNVIGGVENWMVIILFTAMVVVTMAIVICRYVLSNVQFTAGEEIARYLMIWCGYAGASMGFRTKAHVGVVVFADKLPNQKLVLKIRHIISTAILAVVFIIAILCFNQYVDSGKLTTATRIPTSMVYVVIPITMALSIVHTILDITADFSSDEEEEVGQI